MICDVLTTPHELAEQLQAELARRNIPAHLVPLGSRVSIGVYYRLAAHTDGRVIWWVPPRRSRRGGDLLTYAHDPAHAADRLAADYATLRRVPEAELADAVAASKPWQALPHPTPGLPA
jgi:hypothetical protein